MGVRKKGGGKGRREGKKEGEDTLSHTIILTFTVHKYIHNNAYEIIRKSYHSWSFKESFPSRYEERIEGMAHLFNLQTYSDI